MRRKSLIALLAVLLFTTAQRAFAADREGIDCGCDEVGTYNILSKGKLPEIVITSVTTGTSKNGTYELTVGSLGNQVTLTVRKAGGPQLVSETFTPAGGAHWGFSPDEHRFVYHYMDGSGHHYVNLFDLENGGAAINDSGYGYITGDSELYFSPHGHYFFYAAQLDPTHTFLSIVSVSQSPYPVYDLTLGLVLDPANKSGLAAWGFNKKIQDAAATTDAAFLYGYKTSSTSVTWRLIDLASMTVHANDSVTSGTWWGFSPCGDILGIIESDTKNVRLISTADGSDVYDEGYSGTAAQLSCTLAEHLLNGQPLSPAVHNTADNPCPGPLDIEAPTWPTDPASTLEASDITGTSMTLSWSEAHDDVAVTQYQLYQDGQSIALLDATLQRYDVNGLSPSTEYTFKVEAGDAANNWSNDGPPTQVTTVDSPPYWPMGTYLEVNDVTETSLTLRWQDANDDVGVTQYKVYEANYPNDIELGTVLAGDELSFEVTGLTAFKEYNFYVQAGDAKDNWSGGLWAWVRTLDLTAPVWRPASELTATNVTENSLTLNWNESDVTDNVEVQFYLLYLDDELFDLVGTGIDGYDLDCLLPGTEFHFKIEASDPAGNLSDTGPSLIVTTLSGIDDCVALTERVSVSSAGEQTYAWKWIPWGDPNGVPSFCDDPYGAWMGGEVPPCEDAWSFGADISADGRFVSFYSNAVNLAGDDKTPFSDVFVHDRQTGTTELVSLDPLGEQFNYQLMHDDRQDIDRTSISADGRYVVFMHRMTVVYVHDRQTGETQRVAGSTYLSTGLYFDAVISGNGRYVAYSTDKEQLQLIDAYHVYVYDTVEKTTTRVSCVTDSDEQSNSGPYINGGSDGPSLSADGRYVAFASLGKNLVPGDTNLIYTYSWRWGWIYISCKDIFVRDTHTKKTTRVSVSSSGVEANEQSWSPAINADGRYVAFLSAASNLVAGDTNGKTDVFVHDRHTGKTTRVSVSGTGEQANDDAEYHGVDISADGRFVTFASSASNLVSDDTNGQADIFVHDCLTGQTKRVSVCACNTQANSSSNMPAISADGKVVAFQSSASNLLPNMGDTNRQFDIFVHEQQDILPGGADLAVTKSWQPDVAAVGVSLTYTITVANNGPDDACGVILTDTLPPEPNLTFDLAFTPQGTWDQNDNIITFNLGQLDANDSVEVTIQATVNVEGTIINTAEVLSDEFDPNSTNNTATVTQKPDADRDGLSDEQEQGPDGNDIDYDGNGDGVADSQQDNVASCHTVTGDYVTIACPNDVVLSDVNVVHNPSPADTPAGVEMPYGFFEFTLNNVGIGGAVTVNICLPDGAAPTTYYKYGATPDDPSDHWYEFLYDGQTGAEIAGNVITLHFVDGQRGDNDITANGVIVEPGGPGGPVSCTVDFELLAALCQQWLDVGPGLTADLDYSNDVDFIDYGILANYWHDDCPTNWRLK